MSALAPQILALALLCAALAAAFAALMARALLAMCLHLAAFGALTVAALLSLGEGEGALAAALAICAWAPLLLLAGILLSARAAKAVNRSAAWPSLLAAAFAGGMMLLATADIGPAPAANTDEVSAGFWLAPLLLVAAAACVGLLGYGERGAFGVATDDEQ